MDRTPSDENEICRQLAKLETTSDIDTTLLDDEIVAVTATLDEEAPESTIEIDDGKVIDYEIHVGPYRPYDRYVYTVLSREIRELITQDDCFPNGEYELHTTHDDGEFTVELTVRSVSDQPQDSGPVTAIIDDIEIVLNLHETMGRPV